MSDKRKWSGRRASWNVPADLVESVNILRVRIAAADLGARGIPAKRALAMIKKRWSRPGDMLAAGAGAHKIGG